jgi:cell division protein FtsL
MTEVEYSGIYRSLGLNAEARQSAIRWMLKVLRAFLRFALLEFCFFVLLLFCALSRTHTTFSFRLLLSSVVELHSGSSAID